MSLNFCLLPLTDSSTPFLLSLSTYIIIILPPKSEIKGYLQRKSAIGTVGPIALWVGF